MISAPLSTWLSRHVTPNLLSGTPLCRPFYLGRKVLRYIETDSQINTPKSSLRYIHLSQVYLYYGLHSIDTTDSIWIIISNEYFPAT